MWDVKLIPFIKENFQMKKKLIKVYQVVDYDYLVHFFFFGHL
jgi:hypothetical protein